MKLSVVVTVYNEEDNVIPLCQKEYEALEGIDYELILVDDGSTDKTVENAKSIANERTKVLIFNKNYGQSTAMSAGIAEASGEYIVTMDGDLQNDPADIPKMMEKLETSGMDVVAGVRANRKDGFVLRKFPSKIANWIIRNTTDVRLTDYGCSLRIYKSDIAKNLGLYGELHRFIPVLAKLQGAKMTEVDVNHHARIHGESKYGINRTFKVMADLILMIFFQKYFRRPMHLFGGLGIITFALGFMIDLYLVIYKFVTGADIWGRPLLLLGSIMILAGIQFITVGIIAELMMRTYFESQNKTVYRLKETYIGQAR
ncbi:glycosyltransferase family 2 protein [Roseivirga misakiensis]|uniref:Family 2 glycosyl transferase n=1 Tax=Roseivirga misakiensis TaxID=1563681 RepID=A0A1E5SZU3_9BACT|nr:glycosyltransferase family 2 protein [Roseivirga misakiensis]OEK04641.1 family 2 glycosyl transferase [Roseivirga misakiensis]